MLSIVAELVLTAAFPLQSGLVPRRTRAFILESVFEVFLLLGTLVGIIVVGYIFYNAYKYHSGSGNGHVNDGGRFVLGGLLSGSDEDRELSTSFFISMVIVISLISRTCLTPLYTEEGPASDESLNAAAEGYQLD